MWTASCHQSSSSSAFACSNLIWVIISFLAVLSSVAVLSVQGVLTRGREASTNYWAQLCCVCFVIVSSIILCPLYKLTRSAQAQSLCNLESVFLIYCKDL
jgi:hypothetical protein